MFQTMTSAFLDEFEWLRKKKTLLMIALCLLEFLLGIPCICQGGIYYLQIMDWYSSTFSLMILSFTELMVIAWIYGAEQFYRDIEIMIGYRPCLWWKILWCFITPFVIMFVLMFSIINHMPVTYGDYEYPNWAVGIGWIFALCSIIPLPAIAIFKIFTTPGPIIQRLKKLVHHTDEWGPSLEKNRIQWENMNKSHGIGPVDVEMQQPFTSPTVYPVKELNDMQPVETNHVEEPPSYNAL